MKRVITNFQLSLLKLNIVEITISVDSLSYFTLATQIVQCEYKNTRIRVDLNENCVLNLSFLSA